MIRRDLLWLGLSQSLSAVIVFGSLRWLTAALTPDAYGTATLMQGLLALAVGTGAQPYLQGLLRFANADAPASRQHAARSTVARRLVILSAWGAPLLLAAVWLWPVLPPSGYAWLGLLAAVDGAGRYRLVLLNAAGRMRAYALWSGADQAARALLPLAAVHWWRPDAVGVMAGTAVGALLALVIGILTTRRATPLIDSAAPTDAVALATVQRDLATFARPLLPLAALAWTVSLSDRYLIAWLSDLHHAGIYAAMSGLVNRPLQILVAACLLPAWRARHFMLVESGAHAHATRRLHQLLLGYLALIAAGVVISALAGRWLLGVVLAPDYLAYAQLLPLIVAGFGLMGAAYLIELELYARHATGAVLTSQLAGALTTVGLGAGLFPFLGVPGVAVACVLAGAVQAGSAWLLAARARRKDTP